MTNEHPSPSFITQSLLGMRNLRQCVFAPKVHRSQPYRTQKKSVLCFLKSLKEKQVILTLRSDQTWPTWPTAMLLQSNLMLLLQWVRERPSWDLFQDIFPFSVFFHVLDVSYPRWIVTLIRWSLKSTNLNMAPHPFLCWRISHIKGCLKVASLSRTGNSSVVCPRCAVHGKGFSQSQERLQRVLAECKGMAWLPPGLKTLVPLAGRHMNMCS